MSARSPRLTNVDATPTPALALLLRFESGFELEGSLAGGVGLGDCRTVRMRVAAVEVAGEVVTEGIDFENGVEDEDEEVRVRCLKRSKSPKTPLAVPVMPLRRSRPSDSNSLVYLTHNNTPIDLQYCYTMFCVG